MVIIVPFERLSVVTVSVWSPQMARLSACQPAACWAARVAASRWVSVPVSMMLLPSVTARRIGIGLAMSSMPRSRPVTIRFSDQDERDFALDEIAAADDAAR